MSKNFRTRLVPCLLALFLIFGTMSALSAFAETTSGTCGENATWSLNTATGVLTISGSGEMNSPGWHDQKNEFKSVVIEDGITSIGAWAFASCVNLVSVTVPDSVSSIEDSAFIWCDSLTSIAIPAGVKNIGTGAFSGCDNLTEISVSAENQFYSSEDGVLFNKDKTTLICCPTGKKGDYIVPDGVKNIGDEAFIYSNLSTVTVPYGVETIGYATFYGCEIMTSVVIPDSVTSIGAEAFSLCGNLASVIIPNGVKSVETQTFDGCVSLTSVAIPNSVTSIGEYAFCDCDNLATVIIPDSVTVINAHAFDNCGSLTSVTVPKSVKSIGEEAFGFGFIEYGDHHRYEKYSNFTLYGYKGTAVETYANENGFAFIPITGLTDSASGISVSGGLPDGAQLKVTTVESSKKSVTYDITLFKNGAAVQPDGRVTVKIPVPVNMDGTKCRVYHVDASGVRTDMKAVCQDGMLIFETDHFSNYVIEETAADPGNTGNAQNTGNSTGNTAQKSPATGERAPISLWLALLCLSGLTGLAAAKKCVK